MGFTKKKRFDSKETRGMQSRINLKFPEMSHAPTQEDLFRHRHEDAAKLAVLQEFNRQYDEKFYNNYQIIKNRNVSQSSPFNKFNKPPPGYVEFDRKLPSNPTKMMPNEQETKNLPLAGHLTEIG